MTSLPWFILTTLYGACVGSFLNVVMYRVPAGRSLWSPPSHCPVCEHKLAWFDNVPVLGWLWLRGRCRYCRTPINLQYPVVEAVTAAAFALLFVAYYHAAGAANTYHPGFAPIAETWPVFLVHLILIASLIAASGIDARLYIIPLPISWCVTIVAIVVLPVYAWWTPASAQAHIEVLPSASGTWSGMAIGGIAGLIIAVVLLRLGVLPLSFADLDPQAKDEADDDPEESAEAKAKPEGKKESRDEKKPAKKKTPASNGRHPSTGKMQLLLVMLTIGIALAALGGVIGQFIAVAVLWWGIFLTMLEPPAGEAADEEPDETPDEWLAHPHPRREVAKEMLFLALPVAGMVLGAMFLGEMLRPSAQSPDGLPMVFRVLTGVLAGYLVGGGIVWLIRILGTLGFGKEAMGLGDVHLLAAIGAVIGPIDSVLVFFLAPFVALIHTAIVAGLGPVFKNKVKAIPYGPHLCGAALLLMVFHQPIHEAINLSAYLPLLIAKLRAVSVY